METALMGLHITVAIFLILVVLLQSGKGGMGALGGGGTSQSVFGSRGPASFLAKLTTVAAVLFMVTSLSLSTIGAPDPKSSVVDSAPAAVPATPAEEAEEDTGGFDPFKAGIDAVNQQEDKPKK